MLRSGDLGGTAGPFTAPSVPLSDPAVWSASMITLVGGEGRRLRPGRAQWALVVLGLATLWFLVCLWHAVTGDGFLASVPHAPNSPMGYTTLGGLPLAAAAAGFGNGSGYGVPGASGPQISSGDPQPGVGPGPDDGQDGPPKKRQPFWFPEPGQTWSEKGLRRTSDWIAEGDSDWSRLGRTIAATIPIAVMGVGVYAEDGIRNNWAAGPFVGAFK